MPTLAYLKSVIANDLHRTDLTNQIADAIDASVRYYSRERFPWLEGTATLTAVPSTAWTALPTDFHEADNLKISFSGSKVDVIPTDYNEIDSVDTGRFTGTPSKYAVYADKIRWYPVPDATYTATLSYHKGLDLPSASGSNSWTADAFDLLRFRSEWDLFAHNLWNPERASFLKEAEMAELNSLRSETTKKLTTGKIKKASW